VQVGLACLVLAALVWWRGKAGMAPWLGGLGGLLVLAGLVIPRQLGPVYRAWMGLALVLSKVTTPIFMGIVFFLVITPVGLLMRALGKRPLEHVGENGGRWMSRSRESGASTGMERQF
jgi:hypothetical protein